MAKLDKAVASGSAALAKAKTPAAQAAATRRLQAAYRAAATTLRGQRLSPADRGANDRLIAALGGVAKTYGQATAAAKHNNKAGFQKAGAAVKRAQQELAGALAGLRAAGYQIQS
jgi:hypothetical protein